MSTTASGFDALAPAYDKLWTDSIVGRVQRELFWHRAGKLFKAGETILDLGCGTGDDAARLARMGMNHFAIDISRGMVEVARQRGVNAHVLPIEEIGSVRRSFDGAISNFGALNCISRLSDLREPLARMIRPAGYLAVCVMGRFCLWETIWYALHGQLGKAVRRWKGEAPSSLGVRVFYPTVRDIARSLSTEFDLESVAGIGISVPPSAITGLPGALVERLGRIDAKIGSCRGLRAISDHRLLVFRRA
jgi:ubiquinone/menaquinone biosynthesis C-methylase UbiE